MNFQNYIVKDGQAVPENALSFINVNQNDIEVSSNNKQFEKFETWKQSHTYATNAKDGVYAKERFDFVHRVKLGNGWNTITEAHYKSLIEYEKRGIDKPIQLEKFAKLKEGVEKPKESAQLTIGDTSFTKLHDGFIQILTKNGCVELMPDEIEQLAKFIK